MATDPSRWPDLARTRARSAELWRRAEDAIRASEWVRGDRPGFEPARRTSGERLLGACAWCGCLRNRRGGWARLPDRLRPRGCSLTHTICPACWERECPDTPYPG